HHWESGLSVLVKRVPAPKAAAAGGLLVAEGLAEEVEEEEVEEEEEEVESVDTKLPVSYVLRPFA
ncbi:MAG: hypothetical protein KAQ73_06255, partial [Dehalococcoidia bacterium]|nr:hypothetical protein [Dehalococcoidia bacterium]